MKRLKIVSTLCDWETACLITVELSIEVGYFHRYMVCFVIIFGLWYCCHGFILFGDGGLFFGTCSLALLLHVAIYVYVVTLM